MTIDDIKNMMESHHPAIRKITEAGIDPSGVITLKRHNEIHAFVMTDTDKHRMAIARCVEETTDKFTPNIETDQAMDLYIDAIAELANEYKMPCAIIREVKDGFDLRICSPKKITKTCPECDSEINAASNFCPNCGKKMAALQTDNLMSTAEKVEYILAEVNDSHGVRNPFRIDPNDILRYVMEKFNHNPEGGVKLIELWANSSHEQRKSIEAVFETLAGVTFESFIDNCKTMLEDSK